MFGSLDTLDVQKSGELSSVVRPVKILPFTCSFAAADPVSEAGAVGNPHGTSQGSSKRGVIQ